MNYIYKDNNFIKIVDHILNNQDFNKIKEARHHGSNRFDHSLRVSYYSYRISRFFGFDYEEAAKAALLHDFFMTDNQSSLKDAIISNFVHAKEAANNAMKYFELSLKEEDIIVTHMFPINIVPPKYIEGWVVTSVDKVVATYEHLLFFSVKIKLAYNLLALFLVNYIR